MTQRFHSGALPRLYLAGIALKYPFAARYKFAQCRYFNVLPENTPLYLAGTALDDPIPAKYNLYGAGEIPLPRHGRETYQWRL